MSKALVVLGASSDMGIALIKKCGMNYDMIVVHYRTMNDNLKAVLTEYSKKEIVELQIDFAKDDLRTNEKFKQLVPALQGKEIHLVHFPAVQCNNNRFHKIPWDIFQKEIDVSLKSFVAVSQALIPLMQKVKCGRIVLMLSYLAENIPPKYCANYVTTKYALLGLMKSLAVEYAEKGICINGVSPATVDTKYISNQPEVLLNGWIEKSPLGRNLNVNEVVPTIEFLLSEGAACINGENILVSCGMQAH